MDERYGKSERLRKRSEIRNALRRRGIAGKYFIVHIRATDKPVSRFTAIAGRRSGKAVVRNRAKRRVREILRRIKNRLKSKVDIVIRTQTGIQEASYAEMEDDLIGILKQQNLL
ncbi:MAG: ribonuclease P protein component [Candidatus Omnitrophota bacterium]